MQQNELETTTTTESIPPAVKQKSETYKNWLIGVFMFLSASLIVVIVFQNQRITTVANVQNTDTQLENEIKLDDPTISVAENIVRTDLTKPLTTSDIQPFPPLTTMASWQSLAEVNPNGGAYADFVFNQNRQEIFLENGVVIIEKIDGFSDLYPSVTNYCGFRLFYNGSLIKEFNHCIEREKHNYQVIGDFIHAYSVSPNRDMLALEVLGDASPYSFSKEDQFIIFNEATQEIRIITRGFSETMGWLTNAQGYYLVATEPNPLYNAETADLDNAGCMVLSCATDANGIDNYQEQFYYGFFE